MRHSAHNSFATAAPRHRSRGRGVVALVVLLWALVATAESGYAQPSDRELLRAAGSKAPAERERIPYGIEPSRKSLSPLYHGVSSVLYLWENFVAPEVCAPGGYATSNTDYYKALWQEFGPLRALPLGFDRMVRNTKVGRASAPVGPRGLIEDSPKRYRIQQ